MPSSNYNISGLTNEQVLEARNKHGNNQLIYKKENGFLDAIKSIIKDHESVLQKNVSPESYRD